MEGTKHVFIGNLVWETNSELLLDFLMKSGDVVSAKVQRHEDTKRSKGWGLAEFRTAEAAARAVQTLNGVEFNGRKVHMKLDRRIEAAANLPTNNVFVGNLPWSSTPQQLLELFSPYNPLDCEILTNMFGRSRGFGIVKFASLADAERAIAALNQTTFEGRQIECRHDKGPVKAREESAPRDSIFVKMGPNVDDEQFYNLFVSIGPIASAVVQKGPNGKSKGWGIVKFHNPDHAQLAVDRLNGTRISSLLSPLEVRIDRK